MVPFTTGIYSVFLKSDYISMTLHHWTDWASIWSRSMNCLISHWHCLIKWRANALQYLSMAPSWSTIHIVFIFLKRWLLPCGRCYVFFFLLPPLSCCLQLLSTPDLLMMELRTEFWNCPIKTKCFVKHGTSRNWPLFDWNYIFGRKSTAGNIHWYKQLYVCNFKHSCPSKVCKHTEATNREAKSLKNNNSNCSPRNQTPTQKDQTASMQN